MIDKGKTIKKREILYIISEISESLSLTDKNNLIVESALDSLSENLGVDCSWVQLTNTVSNELYLASSRNFTQEIRREMAQMDINHYLAQEVVGLGNKIVIPYLSMDGSYGMSVFEEAGFQSLIAVPITTYKVLGIMGAAYRIKRKLDNDFSELFAVIANLLGMALNKDTMTEHAIPPEDNRQSGGRLNNSTNKKAGTEEDCTIIDGNAGVNYTQHTEHGHEAFQEHVKNMDAFHKLHK